MGFAILLRGTWRVVFLGTPGAFTRSQDLPVRSWGVASFGRDGVPPKFGMVFIGLAENPVFIYYDGNGNKCKVRRKGPDCTMTAH